MPRTARSIVGGHCYHLISRSNGRARVFHEHGDYAHFLSLIAEAQERIPLGLLAGCLMPNHVHLVIRPDNDDDLARWTHWVLTTHVRRHHAKYGSTGRLWQGRYKAFVIEETRHLLTVMRYVERNALRAGLVARAEHWRWGSLNWRAAERSVLQLAAPAIALPSNWVEYVNEAQSPAELEEIRMCVNRQRPFGNDGWVEAKARELDLVQSLASIGRPKARQ